MTSSHLSISVSPYKDIDHHLDGLVPCNEPLAAGIDYLVGFAGPKDDLQLPNPLSMSLMMGKAVLSHEDMVEVDSLPSE